MKIHHILRRIKRLSIGSAMLIGASLAAPAFSSTVSTQFNTSDGFITGNTAPITLSDGGLQVTFSGGQQQQMFDLQSYNANPAGFLWINGGINGFTGSFGNVASGDGVDDDAGLIDFNIGVVEVSFFAANRGNGPGVTLNIFGVDDTTLLDTVLITQTSNQDADGVILTTLTSSAVGGLIGSIGIDLPGPAGNPPYVLAIDAFSALDQRAPVPEPTILWLTAIGILGLAGVSRRNKIA